jgi:hypothetical protein
MRLKRVITVFSTSFTPSDFISSDLSLELNIARLMNQVFEMTSWEKNFPVVVLGFWLLAEPVVSVCFLVRFPLIGYDLLEYLD